MRAHFAWALRLVSLNVAHFIFIKNEKKYLYVHLDQVFRQIKSLRFCLIY